MGKQTVKETKLIALSNKANQTKSKWPTKCRTVQKRCQPRTVKRLLTRYQSNEENLGQVQDAEERQKASNIAKYHHFPGHTFSE